MFHIYVSLIASYDPVNPVVKSYTTLFLAASYADPEGYTYPICNIHLSTESADVSPAGVTIPTRKYGFVVKLGVGAFVNIPILVLDALYPLTPRYAYPAVELVFFFMYATNMYALPESIGKM